MTATDGSTTEPTEHPASATTAVRIDARREDVFDRLIDPRTYPAWLAGAQRIRAVDPDWPAVGSRFHHRVGWGPLHLDDSTAVVRVDRPNELTLRASVGPLGKVLVRFRLHGSRPTVVVFDEAPERGLVRVLGTTIGRMALKAGIWGRNTVSLQQLRDDIEAAGAPDA